MTQTVNARFANGVLTPLEPIDLPEGALVSLHIGEIADPAPDASDAGSKSLAFADGENLADRIEPFNYNRLNDELLVEEYFEKERRSRERSA